MQKKNSKMYRRVRQDVRRAYAPVFAGLGKQKDIAAEQRDRDTARVGNIYDNLAATFNPLNAQFGQTAQQILSGANQALSGVSGAGQEAGIAGLLGAMGQNYGAMLGTGLQGTLGNIAGLESGALRNRADIETNVLNRYRDFVNDLSLQRSDLKAQRAQTFLQELNNRRDFRLAKKEQKIREEQFDKQFHRQGQQDRKDQEAQDWVLSQAQREALETKRSRWRKELGVPDLRNEVAAIREQIASGTVDPIQMPALNERLKELQNELARKRKTVKKRTRRYKKKVGN